MKSNQPHDKFIKKIFTDRNFIIAYFKKFLSKAVLEFYDLENIVFGKENFLDLDWRENRMDMLYRIPSKKNTSLYLYVLFEHKSYHDPKIYFQLLKSLLKIYQWQMQTEKRLSIILPFVFYHGKEKWNLGYSFRDLFSLENTPEEIQKYIPNFAIDIFELSTKDKEIQTEDRYLNLYLRLLQIIRESSEDFQRDFLPILLELSKESDTSKKIEILGDLVQYILSTRNDAEKYTKRETYELLGDEFMTVLDKIIAKGKEEGKLEKAIESARKMREEGDSKEKIIRITGLSEEQLGENGIV